MDVIFAGIIGIIIGFVFGQIKFFREEKHRAYRELLPPIIKAGYYPEKVDQTEYNKALTKLWLYANKEVAKKMDRAVSIIHDHKPGNKNEAFQEAIIAMRKDLRMKWPFGKLEPEDIDHFYSMIGTIVK